MADLKAYNPTLREKHAEALQKRIISLFNTNPYRAMQLAQKVTGGPGRMGLADIVPLWGDAYAGDEAGRQVASGQAAFARGDNVGGLLDTGLGLGTTALLAMGPVGKLGKAAAGEAADAAGAGLRHRAERVAEVTRAKRRVGTTGQYVGAPEGIDNPAKYNALINHYVDTMNTGLAGRNFYVDSSKDIWSRAGHDPNQADLLAQNLAVLSRSNNVGGNTSMSAKAHVQAATGDPVRTGRFPSKDSPPLQAMYDAGRVEYLGHKRDPFATQLSVEWAPERIGRGVNDMHEAEIIGYPAGKVGGATQHAFMDEVRANAIDRANKAKLGGFEDWNTGNAQAAAWSGNKIRRGEIKPGEGARSYADYFPLHEANATYEAVTGQSTGHLPGLLGAPFETRQAFTLDPRGSWNTSPSGRDIGYTAARMLPGETAASSVGRFEGSANPAFVARPVIATETIDAKLPTERRAMTEGSQKALTAVEAARAYWDAQDAGAWHKIMPAKSAADYRGAAVDFGRPFTKADMEAVAPVFEAKGYFLGSAPNGITVMANPYWNDVGTKVGKDMADEVRGILKANKDLFKGSRVEFGALASDYIDLASGRKAGPGGAAKVMLEKLDAAPKTRGLLEDSPAYREAVVARSARDLDPKWNAGPTDPRMILAREIFKKEGWEGIRRAAAAGTIPIALLTAGAFGAEEGLLGD
jgi:hypothetical protein